MPVAQSLCPPDILQAASQRIGQSPAEGLKAIEAAIADYPGDARLHFLKGSVLASFERYGEACESMARAVELAPEFSIARFQWGLLMFTSGDAVGAERAWAPLEKAPADPGLSEFVRGLRALARDEFHAAVDWLRQGLAKNTSNPPLNHDMQMLIDEIGRKLADPAAIEDATSPTHQLLQQPVSKPTRH